ncbi:MAG: DsrE family protein [Betaproteobacteria bacterium]|nr:DsrE family protein [Betaproteobacteria bacterium]
MPGTLFILNETPYGSERTYNALRLAVTLAAQTDRQVRVFLMGDAVASAKAGQKVPAGYYNAQTMLDKIVQRGEVALCGTCMDARGLRDEELLPGCRRSTMVELGRWTAEAGKVLVF